MVTIAVFSFVCGWACSWILEEIVNQIKKYGEIKERLKEFELEQSKCPHGYENWDDCPDCCH